MELKLRERIELLLNWPTKGSPLKLIILDEIKSMITLTKEEREEYEIVENIDDNGRISIKWNTKGLNYFKDFDFSSDQKSTLKEFLDKMEDDFPESLLDLYKKLI